MQKFEEMNEVELQEVNGGKIRLEGNIANVKRALEKADRKSAPYIEIVEDILGI